MYRHNSATAIRMTHKMMTAFYPNNLKFRDAQRSNQLTASDTR